MAQRRHQLRGNNTGQRTSDPFLGTARRWLRGMSVGVNTKSGGMDENPVRRAAGIWLSKIGRKLVSESEAEAASMISFIGKAASRSVKKSHGTYHAALTNDLMECDITDKQKGWIVRCTSEASSSSSTSNVIDFFFQDSPSASDSEVSSSSSDLDIQSQMSLDVQKTIGSSKFLGDVLQINSFVPKILPTTQNLITPIDIASDVFLDHEISSSSESSSTSSSVLSSPLPLSPYHSASCLESSSSPSSISDFLYPSPTSSPPIVSSCPPSPKYSEINIPSSLANHPALIHEIFTPSSSLSPSHSLSPVSSEENTSSSILTSSHISEKFPTEEFIEIRHLEQIKGKKQRKTLEIRDPLKVLEMRPIISEDGEDITPRMLSVYEHGWSQKGKKAIPNSSETLYLYNQRIRNISDNLPTFSHWTRLYAKPPKKSWVTTAPQEVNQNKKSEIEFLKKQIILCKSNTFCLLDLPSTIVSEKASEYEDAKAKNAFVENVRYNRSIGLLPRHKCWQTSIIYSTGHLKEKSAQKDLVHVKDKCIMVSPFLIDEAYNENPEKPDHSYSAFLLYYKSRFENSCKLFSYFRLFPERLYSFQTMCNRMERYLKYVTYQDVIAKFEGLCKEPHLRTEMEMSDQKDATLPMWAQKKRAIVKEPIPYIEFISTLKYENTEKNYSVSAMIFNLQSTDILAVSYKPRIFFISQDPGSESESEPESGVDTDSISDTDSRLPFGQEQDSASNVTKDQEDLESLFNLEEYESSKAPVLLPKGLVYCWTIKNCERPERIFEVNGGVTSLAFSKTNPYLLAVGTTEGTVSFYDIRHFESNSLGRSEFTLCKGSAIQVGWSTLNLPTRIPREIILAVSENGYFFRFFPEKEFPGTLIRRMRNVMFQDRDYKSNELIPNANYVLCTSFAVNNENNNLCLMGSKEGLIYQISERFESYGYDNVYFCHGEVREVKWSSFFPNMFLSCGDDAYLRIWEKKSTKPLAEILTHTEEAIISADWSDLSSKVVVLITKNRIELWNICWIYTPIAVYDVRLDAKLTCVRFNPRAWSIAVGDDLGNVHLYEVKDMYQNF